MFTGFTDATVDFLWGIRFNNERPWFEAHKETYLSELYRPMKDLGAEIYDFLSERRPEDAMMCRVSRIYRDARRLHGRGPYKDHLWFCVERPAEDWTTRPTFWFELGPDYWGYGMGCWMARPMDMAKLRSRIVRDPKPMEKLTKALRGQTEFTLGGDTYKRPKAGAVGAAGAVVPDENHQHHPRGETDGGAVQPGCGGPDQNRLHISAALLRLFSDAALRPGAGDTEISKTKERSL